MIGSNNRQGTLFIVSGIVVGVVMAWVLSRVFFGESLSATNSPISETSVSILRSQVRSIRSREDAPILDDMWPVILHALSVFDLRAQDVNPNIQLQRDIPPASGKRHVVDVTGPTPDVLALMWLLQKQTTTDFHGVRISPTGKMELTLSLTGR